MPFPSSHHRPFQHHSYTASPLHKSLTPPPYESRRGRDSDLEPLPSIESSLESASSTSVKNFPLSSSALNPPDSSPTSNPFGSSSSLSQRQDHRYSSFMPSILRNNDVQIYCANCRRPWPLNECYACTECICGVCRECVGLFIGSPPSSFVAVNSSPANGIPAKGNGGPLGPTSYPGQRGCPRCHAVGGQWKTFQLEVKVH